MFTPSSSSSLTVSVESSFNSFYCALSFAHFQCLVDLVSSLFLYFLSLVGVFFALQSQHMFQSTFLQLLQWCFMPLHPLSSSSSSSYPLSLLLSLSLMINIFKQTNQVCPCNQVVYTVRPLLFLLPSWFWNETTALWYSRCLGFGGNTG